EAATQQQAFIELIGDELPADFRYVSVSAPFDLGEWRDRLVRATALPDQFYRSMIGVAGVYLQRQTLDPATGQWGDTTIIEPLPNQIAYLSNYEMDYTDQQAEQIVAFIEQNQQQIAQPAFPPLAGNDVWLPPWSEYGKLDPA